MKHVVEAANGLRERKKARTREAIIDAALDLFERQGFEATTIEEIAGAADVSPRTFFRYFDSKVDLVMARNEAHGDKIGRLVAARPPGEAPLDALRQVLQQMLSELVADPSVVRELKVMMSTPTLRKLAREHFYEDEAELVSAFAARLGRDERDLAANVMAGAAASTLWTVIDRWLAEGSEVDRLPSMIDQAFELLEQGLGPRPSTPRPPRPTTRSGRRPAASTPD